MFRGLLLLAGVFAAVSVFADGTLRDPTKPLDYAVSGSKVAKSAKLPRLSSILIGADRRLAVVDGRLMSEGEERSGMKVWKINPDRVVVSLAGQQPVTLLLDTDRIHKEVR